MLRSVVNSRLLHFSWLPLLPTPNTHDKPVHMNEEITRLAPGEIGMDRIKGMFEVKDGHLTKELQAIITSSVSAIIGGFLIGGITRSWHVPEAFIEENQASQFFNRRDAQRQMQYKFAMAFIKGGANVAIKLGLFCFIFSTSSTCLYVYRGKFDLMNFTSAGALTGCLFKMNMGIRGALAGSFVGTTLGTVYGCLTLGLLYITGTKIEDVYEVHANLMNLRRDLISERAKGLLADDETIALKRIYDTNMETKEKLVDQTAEQPKA
ncbi:RPII140-upstream gene protein [Andrena cerasifolii]|uniref:RPII140-upstream gene protein n=1 Tax=Andrena cerasifolii TaxID=2819439 RepID=UPI004037E0E2